MSESRMRWAQSEQLDMTEEWVLNKYLLDFLEDLFFPRLFNLVLYEYFRIISINMFYEVLTYL